MPYQSSENAAMDSGSDVDFGSHSEHSVEADPEAVPADMECEQVGSAYDALSYEKLCSKLVGQILPDDDRERQCFDIPLWFELGDPHVHYNAQSAKAYETSGEIGGLLCFFTFWNTVQDSNRSLRYFY